MIPCDLTGEYGCLVVQIRIEVGVAEAGLRCVESGVGEVDAAGLDEGRSSRTSATRARRATSVSCSNGCSTSRASRRRRVRRIAGPWTATRCCGLSTTGIERYRCGKATVSILSRCRRRSSGPPSRPTSRGRRRGHRQLGDRPVSARGHRGRTPADPASRARQAHQAASGPPRRARPVGRLIAQVRRHPGSGATWSVGNALE